MVSFFFLKLQLIPIMIPERIEKKKNGSLKPNDFVK